MGISYDPDKNTRNIRERGLSFDLVQEFDWASAYILEDTRRAYPERRYQALGFIGERLHMLVFTPRKGDVRVISLRKASEKEVERYEKAND
jgi:uncharacterized protein